MLNSTPSNFHVEYMSVTQHWSSASEKYAGGDALVTALSKGWQMNTTVRVEHKWFAESRMCSVYHVELHRDGEVMVMPVLHNPYVDKLVSQPGCEIIPVDGGDKRGEQVSR